MSKPKGTTCTSIYLYSEDREQFDILRKKINKGRLKRGGLKLTKNETWRLILRMVIRHYELVGDHYKAMGR